MAVLGQRLVGLTEQMGAVLERSAYSPNIKERRDLSCALFDGRERLLAQAAHIPVHLGAMEATVRAVKEAFPGELVRGDMVLLNDPFAGGSHLPDLTLVAPLVREGSSRPLAYVVNRAHHADLGGQTPGSLPATSRTLEEEGLVLPPTRLMEGGSQVTQVWEEVARASRTPREREGDLQAQVAANNWGLERLEGLIGELEAVEGRVAARGSPWASLTQGLIEASEQASRHYLSQVPKGSYSADERLHDHEGRPLRLQVMVASDGRGHLGFDFTGTSVQSGGNLNAPRAVTAAAVNYVVYCLLQALAGETLPPPNHGVFASLSIKVPEGSLLDPEPGAAVCAGNVETSQRIVDLLFSALAPALPGVVPAHSQGTMNNLLIGTEGQGAFTYYETLGGGCGATPTAPGASGTHSHMTNTLNTPVEALEHAYPLRVEGYRLRRGTGGHGLHRGGDGLERWIRLLAPSATLTLLSGRRETQPQGLSGGGPGLPGEQWVERDGQCLALPAKCVFQLRKDDVVVVRTPGGGGWGESEGLQ